MINTGSTLVHTATRSINVDIENQTKRNSLRLSQWQIDQ